MRKLVCLIAMVSILGAVRAGAEEPGTLFENLTRCWAAAEARPARILKYHDGSLLGIPTDMRDVVYARKGKPRSIFVVYEKSSPEDELPFEIGKPYFAVFRMLPQYAYWRYNLPNIPRHEIFGGRRYVFRGDDIEPAKKIVRRYTETFELRGRKRLIAAAGVVVDALTSPVKVIADDAVRHLALRPVELSLLDEAARDRLSGFLLGDRDDALVVRLVEAIGRAKVQHLVPLLEKLAAGHTNKAGAALRSLDALGKAPATASLIERLEDSNENVRAAAAHILALRAASDGKAEEAVVRVLRGSDDPKVRSAAAEGLAAGGDREAIDALVHAVQRGDEASRAAAVSLARIGGDEGIDELEQTVRKGKGEARAAAVIALGTLGGSCEGCRRFLQDQYEHHPDESVRSLIASVLGVGTEEQR